MTNILFYMFRKDIFSYMALEVGSIVEGTVTGLAKFGVFVELGDKKVGLVHISEVAGEYVSDVNDYLKLHDKVKVKVISVDGKGKIALSIKQVQTDTPTAKKAEQSSGTNFSETRRSGFSSRNDKSGVQKKEMYHPNGGKNDNFRPARKYENPASFEDKLSRFLKDSDERLLDLKRNVESKRGGRGARHTD